MSFSSSIGVIPCLRGGILAWTKMSPRFWFLLKDDITLELVKGVWLFNNALKLVFNLEPKSVTAEE